MKLHLTSAYDSHTGLDALRIFAAMDRHARHTLCNSAADADAIVFVENTQFDDILFRQLTQHTLVQQYPDKVFMYNEMDRPWHVLPGLYCCMPSRHYEASQHVAFAYLGTPNPYIRSIYAQASEKRWLYSFMGSMSHACRRPIMSLKSEHGFVQDTSDFNVWQSNPAEMEVRGRAFADMLASSHFVLCPRGIGTSSLRLYETLEAGRVPVIISDHWVPPPETDWSFALRIEERRIRSIPGLLKALLNEAEDRGSQARAVWTASYAPDSLFNTAADSIESLLHNQTHHTERSTAGSLHKWVASSELLTRHAARKLRNW